MDFLELDGYTQALIMIAFRCEPNYTVNGIVGYLYQSIKDSIKDLNLKPKHYRQEISQIGNWVYLKDEEFNKLLALEQDDYEKKTQAQKTETKVAAMFGGLTTIKAEQPTPDKPVKQPKRQ